jgi:hypothetical protein
MTCNSATQYCNLVVGGVHQADASNQPNGTCVGFDGGKGCPAGGPAAADAGECGCYESPSGDVTNTECVP